MDHEKSSSSFRSDTTPLCSERFCPLHHGFFLSHMDGVYCLLVLNMFALLDHRCLLHSILLISSLAWFLPSAFFGISPSDLFGSLTGHFIAIDVPIDRGGHPYVHLLQTMTASQVLHRLAPSTAVGTTRHYLLDCMVIFCTPFTFHFFRPSSLLDVCSPCVDE